MTLKWIYNHYIVKELVYIDTMKINCTSLIENNVNKLLNEITSDFYKIKIK